MILQSFNNVNMRQINLLDNLLNFEYTVNLLSWHDCCFKNSWELSIVAEMMPVSL